MKLIDWNPDIDYFSYFLYSKNAGVINSLPCGLFKHFPISINLKDKKILNGNLGFYNEVFVRNFSDKNIDRELLNYDFNAVNSEAILINLLDNCFGHSILKLFQLSNFSFAESTERDYVIIIPESIRHYFALNQPNIHLVSVKGSFKSFENLGSFKLFLESISNKYSSLKILLNTLYPICNKENILELVGNKLPEETSHPNLIVFYYRKDTYRMWNLKKQGKSITEAFNFLNSFFNKEVKFVVLGDMDNFIFPAWITDERKNSYSTETDLYYNSLFAKAIITIGLTGSHMLLPSILSCSTAHMIQSYKTRNMAEDVVAECISNSILSSHDHFYYYGNHDCSNISPLDLGRLILFNLMGKFEKIYKFSDLDIDQSAYFKLKHPYFKYNEAVNFRNNYNILQRKKIRLKYNLKRISPF
ncbi:MAG: hypothetical protein ACK5D5_13470 [Bacteroidota bacterium]|jgi:hypothetical protein